jgi:hypothetical protein
VDFGTGDGALIQRSAKLEPEVLFIGVDANADGLREVSRRVASKPSRGGLLNALFARLALEDAPHDLEGIADRLTVMLPWGSLLQGIATGEPSALARLRGIVKHGAEVRIVFGYGPGEERMIEMLDLPDLKAPGFERALESRYRHAGLALAALPIPREDVALLPTTWAKKLAFSSRNRVFWELSGRSTSIEGP